MRPTVSVIVPTYQASQSLQTCLDSLLAQTLTDIEIVVVDDGSTDDTPDVLKAYAQKDPRIVTIRQDNGGVSSARNTGLAKARGQWIAFVDSDDEADKEYLARLLPKEADTDFVVGGYTEHRNGIVSSRQPSASQVLWLRDAAATIVELERDYFLNTPWAKLFKKALVDRHGLTFNPSYCYGEDKLFVYLYLAHCIRMEVSGGTGYHYYNQPDSLSRKVYPPQIIWDWNEDMLNAMATVGKTFNWPQSVIDDMTGRSFTYFTLYMANSIYRQPIPGKERLRMLRAVYGRRRGKAPFDLSWCKGKIQRLAAILYKINSPYLSHIVYTMMCKGGGKGMMR